MRTARAGVLALAFLLWPAARASAEWQIKPFFGGTFAGGTTFPPFAIEQVGEAKRTFGMSGVLIGDIVGVEGDVGWTPGFFQSSKPSAFATSNRTNLLGSSVTTFTGNVVIAAPRRLTEYTLRPYVVGGAGMMRPRTENSSAAFVIESNLAALDIGVGAVGFLTDRVGLSWDIRYFHSIRGKIRGFSVSEPEELSFWRIHMAFVVRLRHQSR